LQLGPGHQPGGCPADDTLQLVTAAAVLVGAEAGPKHGPQVGDLLAPVVKLLGGGFPFQQRGLALVQDVGEVVGRDGGDERFRGPVVGGALGC
jgi:hypothetical protein